jgi:hypothetical protein
VESADTGGGLAEEDQVVEIPQGPLYDGLGPLLPDQSAHEASDRAHREPAAVERKNEDSERLSGGECWQLLDPSEPSDHGWIKVKFVGRPAEQGDLLDFHSGRPRPVKAIEQERQQVVSGPRGAPD